MHLFKWLSACAEGTRNKNKRISADQNKGENKDENKGDDGGDDEGDDEREIIRLPQSFFFDWESDILMSSFLWGFFLRDFLYYSFMTKIPLFFCCRRRRRMQVFSIVNFTLRECRTCCCARFKCKLLLTLFIETKNIRRVSEKSPFYLFPFPPFLSTVIFGLHLFVSCLFFSILKLFLGDGFSLTWQVGVVSGMGVIFK